jgi:hypothetical protein
MISDRAANSTRRQAPWACNGACLGPCLGWPFFRVALLLCCGFGLLSVAMGPDNNWDLRFYHLYAPWAYLHNRYVFDIGPAQYQGFFNPTSDFLFYALTSSRLNNTPRLVSFIMGFVHGINAAMLLAIALHVLRPAGIAERAMLTTVALLMGASGAGFMSLLGTTTNDLINAICVFAALLGLLRVGEPPLTRAAWGGFACSGLMAGIALGLKYTAAAFMPGLGLVALVVAIRRKTLAGLLIFGAAATLGFLAVAGYHLLSLWQTFANPVFPLLNDIFRSPDYEFTAIRDDRFLPRDFWQAIFYPFYWARTNVYLVTELTFRDWRGAIAYVAIAAAAAQSVAHRIRKQPGQRDICAQTRGLELVFLFVVVSFFCWELSSGVYRYGVVLEMLTGVVTVGALLWLCQAPRLRILLSLLGLTMAAVTTTYIDWGRGEHPAAGIRPARYGDKYIDVHVPQLPLNSVVLVATQEPVSYFIPFAEPSAQFLGIENNYLELSQHNRLASEVKRIMGTPGRPKFILSVGDFDGASLNSQLRQFNLHLSAEPCLPIQSNLEDEPLSLCRAIP